MAPGFFMNVHQTPVGAGLLAKAECQSTSMQLTHRFREQARSHKGGTVLSGRFGVEIQHTHARQQIRLRQVRMLMPAECAIHQPVTVLDIEGKASNEVLLFVALCDQVEAVLVFGVQHGVLSVGFEGRQTGAFR